MLTGEMGGLRRKEVGFGCKEAFGDKYISFLLLL